MSNHLRARVVALAMGEVNNLNFLTCFTNFLKFRTRFNESRIIQPYKRLQDFPFFLEVCLLPFDTKRHNSHLFELKAITFFPQIPHCLSCDIFSILVQVTCGSLLGLVKTTRCISECDQFLLEGTGIYIFKPPTKHYTTTSYCYSAWKKKPTIQRCGWGVEPFWV